jgi:hypothetical protein
MICLSTKADGLNFSVDSLLALGADSVGHGFGFLPSKRDDFLGALRASTPGTNSFDEHWFSENKKAQLKGSEGLQKGFSWLGEYFPIYF